MTIHRTWHTLININNIWNFNSLFRVCLIFYIRFPNFKKHLRITPWKKMLLATALALLITGCAQQTFTVQNKPAAVAPKETITHRFICVSGIGQKKTVDAAKICGGAENVVKTETQQTFVNGLLGFITLGIYTPLEAHCVLTIIAWVAHRYGQLYLHCSLIYFWVPSSCFCIVISLSLRVK